MLFRNRIPLLFLLALPLVFSSCLKNSNEVERTEAIELAELNELILKLEMKGFDVDTTVSGVYYIIHEPGEGPQVEPFDTITIGYEAYLTSGQLFDATQNWTPDGKWEFVYLQQQLIEGFNAGLAVMRKNSEVELIVPSSLAYGAYGLPPEVGPFETLIFGVKLYDLKPAGN